MSSLKEKIGYGFGDMSSSMFWKIFSYYLPFFYSNIFGLSLVDAGVLVLVTRIWDAVSDPMMGIISDRTNTKWGKYRPYLLWVAPLFSLCGMGRSFSVVREPYATGLKLLPFFSMTPQPMMAYPGSIPNMRIIQKNPSAVSLHKSFDFIIRKAFCIVGKGFQMCYSYYEILYIYAVRRNLCDTPDTRRSLN